MLKAMLTALALLVLATGAAAAPKKLYVTIGLPFTLDKAMVCDSEAAARAVVDGVVQKARAHPGVDYFLPPSAPHCKVFEGKAGDEPAVLLRVAYHEEIPDGTILKVARLAFLACTDDSGMDCHLHDHAWVIVDREVVGSGITENEGDPI